MTLQLSAAEAVLKDDYGDEPRDFINNSVFIQSQIETNTDDITGRRALHAAHTRRSSGVGNRGDNGTLPTAGRQQYANTYIPVRYSYGRIQLTGPTIEAMGTERGSFVRAIDSEMNGMQNDVARDRNRQIWGTSNGVIAQCGTTSSSTTLQLAAGTTAVQMAHAWADGGMTIDVGTIADPDAVAAGLTVTDYDETNLTLTVSSAVTTSGSHYIFRAGNGGASDGSGTYNDGQLEITGLQTMLSTSAVLHGLDPANEPTWKANVYDNSGTPRAINENHVNKAIHETERKSGKQIKLLVGSDGVSRAVANRLEAIRRNVDNVDLKAGYSGIRWTTPAEGMGRKTDIALCWDRDCPNGTLAGLNTDSMRRYVMRDWTWLDRDGSVWARVANQGAWEATYACYDEIGYLQRNDQFIIKDITEAN